MNSGGSFAEGRLSGVGVAVAVAVDEVRAPADRFFGLTREAVAAVPHPVVRPTTKTAAVARPPTDVAESLIRFPHGAQPGFALGQGTARRPRSADSSDDRVAGTAIPRPNALICRDPRSFSDAGRGTRRRRSTRV